MSASKTSPSKMSPSKMSPTKKKASLDSAHELLTSGKRNLLVTAVPAAVSDLAKCCEIVSKTCGQTADECAEVYYYYGKALLKLSRLENGVLGNALEGVDVDAEDKMVNDEQVANLQLAWKMLEHAKVVYTRMVASATGELKQEMEAKLCDVYLCLGKVSIENKNYGQAFADLTVCMEKRKTTLPSDSRSTAEAWYQLGLNHAIGVLEPRINNLDKMEKSDNIAKEVAGLKVLVAEIKEPAFAGSTAKMEEVRQLFDLVKKDIEMIIAAANRALQ